MRLVDDIYIRKVGGEYIAVTESEQGVDFTKVVKLNESAAYLLGESEGGTFSQEDWVQLLMERYEVDATTATRDVQRLVAELQRANVVTTEE